MYSVKIASLKARQEELKTALDNKANEILKVDAGAGKALIAELGSVFVNGVANGVGVPLKIKIPPKFYTLFLPPFISVFLIPKDVKKKKKLASEFETLTEDYNKVVSELKELEGEELLDTLKDDEKGTGEKSTGTGVDGSGNRSAITQQQYIVFGIILLVLIMIFIYWKRRQV